MEMKRGNGFSRRAFLAGCLFALGVAITEPYSLMMIQPYGMSADFIAGAAVVGLFLLALLINPILSLINRRLAFNSSELLLIYMMMLIASAIPSWGLMSILIPLISGVQYFATPENRWGELVLPHLKPWLTPDLNTATAFFEGTSAGAAAPWFGYLRPLAAWLLLLLLIYFVSICITVILRKQWVENEKLVFPLTILPLEMVRPSEGGGRVPPFFKNRLMWLGFAISFLILSLNGLHYYFPEVPAPVLLNSVRIFRNTMSLSFFLSFPVLGLAYLLNLDIAFSLWLFYLLGVLETGWLNIVGFSLPGPLDPFAEGSIMASFRAMGSMITLVFFGLYLARQHLANVLRKAFRNDPQVDDSDEILSYRTAILGLFIGSALILVWLTLHGLPLLPALVFLFAALVVLTGLSRIICQAGIGFARSINIPPVFTTYSLPSQAIGPAGYSLLGMQFSWSSDIRTTVMASTANSLKINETGRIRPRLLFLALLAALVLAYAGAAWMMLKVGFEHGAINSQQSWFFRGSMIRYNIGYITDKILHPPTRDIIMPRLGFTGVGMAAMGVLMFLRYRFLWWPIHYIGFPIANSYMMSHAWLSIFLAWLLKSIILRYAGPKVYQRSIPFFLGLVLGQLTAGGVWLIIDFITKTTGNKLPIGIG